MNPRLIKRFIKTRPDTILIFVVLLLFLFSGLFSNKIIKYFGDNWESFAEKRINSKAEDIQNLFYQRQNRLLDIYSKLKAELISDINKNEFIPEAEPERYFNLFDEFSKKYNIDLQLVKNKTERIVWNNKYEPIEIPEKLSDTSFSVYSTNFNKYLVLIEKIYEDAERKYYVILLDNIYSDYEINNKFIKKYDFIGEEKDLIIKIQFNQDKNNLVEANKNYKQFDLKFLTGELAGKIFIEKILRMEITASASESIVKLQKLIILVLIVIFYFYLYRDFRKIKSFFVKSLLVSFFLWLLRYLLLYLEIPSSLFPGIYLNPTYFSSSLGNGIVQSPVELMITAIFALINFGYVFILIRRWYIEGNQKDYSLKDKIINILLTLIFILILPLILRAYSETFRSFVFDSSIRYFEDGTIIPDTNIIFMHICIFVSSLAFVLLLLIPLTNAIKTLNIILGEKGKTFSELIIIFIFIVSAILFKYLLNDTGFEISFLLIISVGLFFALRTYKKLETVLNFELFLVMLLVASFSAVYLLLEKNSLKERELQKRIAIELSKPKDVMTGFILNETLQSFINNEEFRKEIKNLNDGSFNYKAYKLWINSLLNTEGINSGVLILDKDLKNRGFFGFGVTEVENLTSYLDREIIKDETVFFSHKDYPDYLFGASRLVVDNVHYGYLLVYILTEQDLNEIVSSKIFANIQDERNPILLLPEVIIYKYNGGEFRLEKGENLPEFRQLPKIIAEKVILNYNQEYWLDEKLEDKDVKTYYYLYSQDNLPKIIAVSLEKKSILWYSYNLFRVVFIHFIISIIFILVIILILVVKKYKFQIHFKSKLFFGLILITLVPLLLLAFYNRQNAIERWNQIQKYEMRKDLDYLESNINEVIPAIDKKEIEKRAASLRKISGKLDLDFDILNITELLYSTEDNLYKIGFFKSGLPAKVYRDIVLNNKPYSFTLEKLENYEYLVGYKKIKLNEDDFIFLSIPTLYKKEKIDSEISKIDAFIFGAYSITLVFIFILGNIIFERISKPLKKLREATQKISAGDLSIKLEPEDRTEVGDLVIAFNKMISDLEESRKSLAAAEREYAWKEMAKQVAHEIKNPLTPMKLSIQHLQLLFKVNRNEFLRLFSKVSNSMVEQIEALNSIAGEFSRFARMPNRNPIKVNLVDLINSVIEIFSANIKINFEYDKESEFLIFADYEEFKRVIMNLIKNSIQAKASEITIKLTAEDSNIILSIIDNGEGIPEEILPRIFEPNFSTKTEGMGLGLSIIKKIITELEGDISISSELNKGTEVKINLKKYNG